jgi:hypothetical protein
MTASVHWPLKVIVFNANGFWRQHYEVSKQLQGLYIDVDLLSETHIKSHERFFIPNYHFYRTDRFPGRKGNPHNDVELCPLVSIEATGVCITIGKSEVLLALYNLVSTVNFPTRSQNGSATAIDYIFIDASLQGNYVIHPLLNGLSDHDAQLIILTELKTYTKKVNVKEKKLEGKLTRQRFRILYIS